MLREICSFLDHYLDIGAVDDPSWNGLQVEGSDQVRSVMCAVDSGNATFERAALSGVDLIVVHHGLFWKGANPSIAGWAKARFDLLYRNGISLYASHLPLDRHPEVGNNAQILKILGAQISGEFLYHRGKNVGWSGVLSQPRPLATIVESLQGGLNSPCTVLPFGKSDVTTIAVASGGTSMGDFYEALNRGVDLYVTGEITDVYHAAKDAGINVIFAGHHASEILGVKSLSEVIQNRFRVECIFVDIPTGL